MSKEQPNNPLHGLTLAAILEQLVKTYGWEGLGSAINVRCFNHDPSIKSSLKFLRKTSWAREKVEQLYVESLPFDDEESAEQSPEGNGESTTESTTEQSPQ